MAAKRKFRTALLKVRITDEEKVKFEKLANSRHTDISEIVRQLLHKEAEQAAA
jgi:hypothetical protein